MPDYTPVKQALPNGIDETGLFFTLVRLPDEELWKFRQRVVLEAMDAAVATQQSYVDTVNRYVGTEPTPVMTIALVEDANGQPVATDPYLEVTATRLRFYSNWQNGAGSADVEIDLVSDKKFLTEALAVLVAATTYLTATSTLPTAMDYNLSKNLRIQHSERQVVGQALLLSRQNTLKTDVQYLKQVRFSNSNIFTTEKSAFTDLAASGDYYIDYGNGEVFSYDTASGAVSYSYAEFPATLVWQPVRAYPYNDDDLKYTHKDAVYDDSGQDDYSVVNSLGARIANTVLTVHPLGWGE